MKPILLSYGNCQAFAMQVITLDLPSVVDRYEVRYLPCHPSLGSTEVEPGLIERCEVVWDQVGVNQHLPFRENLEPGTRSVRFPELSFPLLWPMSCVDPRNVPDPPRHWGQYPCGDRLALQVMKDGLYGAEGYAAWVERGRAAIPDLRRLLDLELARGRRRAADVDLEPTAYIFDNWRRERLFATFNHPSNAILWSLCIQLLEMSLPSLKIPEAELAMARERFMNPAPGAVDMDWCQMVIHPHVAETFGLEWCHDETLHRIEVPGVERKLTRSEYMADHYMARDRAG